VIKASPGGVPRPGAARRPPPPRAARCCARPASGCSGWPGEAATSLLRDPLPERVALVLGNETEGLSEAVRAELDGTVSIPMRGGVESLNVASAAAVASYELLRRREA